MSARIGKKKSRSPKKKVYGLLSDVGGRYHKEQKLTHKEHLPHTEFKTTELEEGTLRKVDAVQIVRAKPDRKDERIARRELAKAGRVDKRKLKRAKRKAAKKGEG